MLRYDHSIFMPTIAIIGTEPGRVRKTYDRIKSIYERLKLNPPVDRATLSFEESMKLDYTDYQLYEEMTGEGFYRPERDAAYQAHLESALIEDEKLLTSTDIEPK